MQDDSFKIAIIEDEKELLENLSDLYKSEGYLPYCYNSSENFFWASKPHDLLLVDIKLPGEDGISLVKKVREKDSKTPILFLTGLVKDEEIIAGLDAGADDYITKPFSSEVLLARTRSVLRRSENVTSPSKGWSIDTESKEVLVNDKRISLSSREFQIFKSLSENRGKVVPRANLISEADNISARNVDVHIVAIRKKLDPMNLVIETIRGVGYRVF